MSAMSRTKGGRGEREIIKILHDHGWAGARRTSDGRAQAARGDVAGGPPGVHLEIRRRETVRIIPWWEQARDEAATHDLPVVTFRTNAKPWLAVVEFEELLVLLRLREM